jgi:hypothetical protein
VTTFLDHAVAEQFLKPPHRTLLIVERQPLALLDRFACYQPPTIKKWLNPDES